MNAGPSPLLGPSSGNGSAAGSQAGSGDAQADASHFRFALPAWLLQRPEDIVRKVRQGEVLSDVLESMGEQRALPATRAGTSSSLLTPSTSLLTPSTPGVYMSKAHSARGHLVFLYIHLELDDLMGFAQLWQLKMDKGEMSYDPIIVWAIDFTDLNTELIFERKQLMASLLGVTESDVYVLLRASDKKRPEAEAHPRAEELLRRRDDTISSICDSLRDFDSRVVHCYISAPCHGNLGAIRDCLSAQGSWPPRGKWKVAMYTGSYNIREGLQEADVEALQDLVSDENPLVDVSRFHFFGRERAHPCTRGLGTFCLPSLAREIGRRDPLLSASIRTFHDEFNKGLIAPDNDRLFVTALTGSDREDFEAIRDEYYRTGDIKSYALSLHINSSLMSKVPDHKKTCIAAFMNDACEAPLCGQLLFMNEWLVQNQSDWLTEPQVGRWTVDARLSHTSVDPGGVGGVRAIQPALADASDVNRLKRLRVVSQAFFLRFLDRVTRTTMREEGDHAEDELAMTSTHSRREDDEVARTSTEMEALLLVPEGTPMIREASSRTGEDRNPSLDSTEEEAAGRGLCYGQPVLRRLRGVARSLFLRRRHPNRGTRAGAKDAEGEDEVVRVAPLDEALPAFGHLSSMKSMRSEESGRGSLGLSKPTRISREEEDAGGADGGDGAHSSWKSVAEGVQSTVNPDDPDGADSCDVVSPRFRGKPLYEQEVRDLGNIMALRGKRLTHSSCGGPVLSLAVWLRVVQGLALAGMAVLAFLTTDCDKDEGVLMYPYWIWVPYVAYAFARLSAEIRIFKHLSIPYIQSVGQWKVLGLVLISHEWSFASWFVVQVVASVVQLFGLGTANIFLGMVTAEHFRGICGPERKMDMYWRFTLGQSVVIRWLSVLPFCGIPLILFGVQFIHLVIDMVLILPGWNQWNTKGLNWRYGKPFPQPLETEVVEYVSPQVGGVSLLGLWRPNGTRFVYYNVLRNLTTTGAALDHICLGSGMCTIIAMDNYIDAVIRDAYSVVPDKATSLSGGAVDRALLSTRKLLQDVLSVLNRRIQVFSFRGILFSALHLQLQVSYHYLRCAIYPSHCHSATRLWIGIAAATLTSGIMIFQIVVTAIRSWDVLTVYMRCKNFVIPVAQDLIQKGSHEHPERCASAISEIDELKHKLGPRVAVLFVLSCLLVLLFAWAVSKMTMDQFVCKDHIWNFRPNYPSGCVNFSAWEHQRSA